MPLLLLPRSDREPQSHRTRLHDPGEGKRDLPHTARGIRKQRDRHPGGRADALPRNLRAGRLLQGDRPLPDLDHQRARSREEGEVRPLPGGGHPRLPGERPGPRRATRHGRRDGGRAREADDRVAEPAGGRNPVSLQLRHVEVRHPAASGDRDPRDRAGSEWDQLPDLQPLRGSARRRGANGPERSSLQRRLRLAERGSGSTRRRGRRVQRALLPHVHGRRAASQVDLQLQAAAVRPPRVGLRQLDLDRHAVPAQPARTAVTDGSARVPLDHRTLEEHHRPDQAPARARRTDRRPREAGLRDGVPRDGRQAVAGGALLEQRRAAGRRALRLQVSACLRDLRPALDLRRVSWRLRRDVRRRRSPRGPRRRTRRASRPLHRAAGEARGRRGRGLGAREPGGAGGASSLEASAASPSVIRHPRSDSRRAATASGIPRPWREAYPPFLPPRPGRPSSR